MCCAIAGGNMSQRAPDVALECVVHCVANHDTCDTLKLKKIRHRALNSNETTQNVINYCLMNLSDNAVARLPDFKQVKRNIQNCRGKNDLPEIPHDNTFNLISDKLTTTKRNTEPLQLLESCEQLLVDGTFKICTFFPMLLSFI
ncbi:unnamed protein product [Rotaria magnacalcarata]|uniref:Uncharacterized protein n=2 Tax=Rotaria magnacalcarata TaxID=392030 RepID=A0A815WTR0_9BILA|nr:unnamed protein product [Rotaria magnacalcarata]CAF4790945.1 unnamed protein product [Rotaria magnacalcarata]